MSIMNNDNIHSTAIISPSAQIAESVKIGPYCCIGPHVKLDENVELKSHVVIEGETEIGAHTVIYPFACIGTRTQDKKYQGEQSIIKIGKNNQIREYVTIQGGTKGGIMQTLIGNDCLLMANTHVAHDCVLGNHVVMANCASLAGHVHVGNHVNIGGLSAVHQEVRIGDFAMISGCTGVARDIIPYGLVMGKTADLVGLNIVGMRRNNIDNEEISQLKQFYNEFFFSDDNNFVSKIQKIKEKFENSDVVLSLIKFLEENSVRSICLPRSTKNKINE